MGQRARCCQPWGRGDAGCNRQKELIRAGYPRMAAVRIFMRGRWEGVPFSVHIADCYFVSGPKSRAVLCKLRANGGTIPAERRRRDGLIIAAKSLWKTENWKSASPRDGRSDELSWGRRAVTRGGVLANSESTDARTK